MKKMAKFANGGYAEHIVTEAQKVETLQALQLIPKAVTDICGPKQFAVNLWKVWDARPPQVSPARNEAPTNNQTVVLGPEEIPLMTFGLSTAQATQKQQENEALVEDNNGTNANTDQIEDIEQIDNDCRA